MAGGAGAEGLVPLRLRYVDQLVAGDAVGARASVEQALALVPIATVYDDLVRAALYDVGRRWERARIGVAEEHVATSITEIVLADLAGRLPQAARRGHAALVACGPGELHAVGCRIVADFLDADGWDVLHLGATTPADALAELTVARRAEVVAISITLPQRVADVARACAQLRRLPFRPTIALGGQAFGDRETARLSGADVAAGTPSELVAALDERFPRG